MESRTGLLRWLKSLLLSAGLTARSQMLLQFRWFRRYDLTDHENEKTKNLQRDKRLKKTMKIRLQILRWLSLMQFPAFSGIQVRKLSHFALFRRT